MGAHENPIPRRRRRPPVRGTAACAAVLLLVSSAWAGGEEQKRLADRSLEELMDVEVATVYGAARREQKVSDAPSSVTIVSRDEIRMFGYHTLAEALQSVRGLYLTYDRQYTSFGIRGFSRLGDYNSRVLLLVNGHRMNDNVYDQALIGTEFPLDMSLVDRIEVIRGPGSALYGTSAFFAVVNVVTRQGQSLDGVELEAATASYDAWRGRVTAGAPVGGDGSWLASVTRLRSDGPDLYFPEFDSPGTHDGRAIGADYDRHDSAFASFVRGPLTVSGLFGSRTKGIPTGAYGTTFGDPRTKAEDTRGYVDMQYRRPAWDDGEVLVRAFYDEYRYDGWWVFDEGETINRDVAVGRWIGGEVLASRQLHPRHRVTAGVEFRGNLRQDQGNYDEGTDLVYLDDKRSSSLWAGYVQDEVTVHSRLQLVIGARYDHAGLTGSTVEPRLGAVYRPNERTAIKGLYGRAFRAPNTYELFYSASPSKANPDLEPETLHTGEAVIEYYVRGLRLSATAYRTGIHELINQTLDESDSQLQYRNLERADAWGTAVDVEYRHKGLLGRASYGYHRVSDPESEVPLSNAPRHVAALAAGAPLWKNRLTIGIEASHESERLSYDGSTVEGSWVARANLVAAIVPGRVDFAVGIGNLFDTRYRHPVGPELQMSSIEQDGRTAWGGFTIKF